MRSILKIEKVKILNIKFKKFKKFKKTHGINKLKLFNFFMAKYHQVFELCQRIMLLESLSGEIFKINKFKFYNNNKKHARLGALIFLKVQLFKKKVVPCLSYFLIYQLFFYYEFFLKAKYLNSDEFSNYFSAKPVLSKAVLSTSFNFFMCWGDFVDLSTYPIFDRFEEIFDESELEPVDFVEYLNIDIVIFYKFSQIIFKILHTLKKNFLKLMIFFYKKYFFIGLPRTFKINGLKLLLAKKFVVFKKSAKT